MMFSHTVNNIMHNSQNSLKSFCDCLTLIFRANSLHNVHTPENEAIDFIHVIYKAKLQNLLVEPYDERNLPVLTV